MWTITKSSWVAEYDDYREGTRDGQEMSGPARVYYRKSDIARALAYYGGLDKDIDQVRPGDSWNEYTDIGALVSANVQPYRVRR